MSQFPPNIFTVLTQQGPTITPSNNNVSLYPPGHGCKTVTEIIDWEDLTATNILSAYGDILIQEHAGLPTVAASIHVNSIAAVPDIKQMEANFLHHLLETSLTQGCGVLASRLVSTNAARPSSYIEIRRDFQLGRARPNTALLWGSQLLVLGATRRDADWDFTAWATSLEHPTAQLAGYATSANTRYTYVVTETDIIFCQFYHLPGTNGQLGVRRKVVALCDSGIDTLTPGLAFWAVTMMALNELHRPIVGLHQTARLNEWIPLFNNENQAVYRNAISAREMKKLPEGAVDLPPPRLMVHAHIV